MMTPPRAAPPREPFPRGESETVGVLPYAEEPEPLTAHEYRVLVLGVLTAAALGASTMLLILRSLGRW